jgi:hypothetical protein
LCDLALRLCVLIALICCAACGAEATPGDSEDGPTAEERVWRELPAGWSLLPPPPFASSAGVAVWTGSHLFYWGGETDLDSTHLAKGAAYDPVGGRWHALPDGPLSGRSWAGAVWTGQEVLIWGGLGEGATGDGAAFDPRSARWRVLSDSPLSPRVPAAVAWTGTEMIVWGDADRFTEARDGAAYDPASDSWRQLPPAPLALNLAEATWTGDEVIVFGALLDGNNHSASAHARGIAYHPQTDTWRTIAANGLSPQASSIGWMGSAALVWDYLLDAALYDPGQDSWSELPDVPLSEAECYPKSVRMRHVILAWYCGQASLFDTERRRWVRIEAPERGWEIYGWPVAAGEVILFPGAAHDGSRNGFWAYRPPNLRP